MDGGLASDRLNDRCNGAKKTVIWAEPRQGVGGGGGVWALENATHSKIDLGL